MNDILFNSAVSKQTAVRASGAVAAPAASAVIADTGNLPAGDYLIEWAVAAMDTVAVGKGMVVEHRDAADAVTNFRLGGCVAGDSQSGVSRRITVAANESVRVIAGTAAGAASSLYVASIAAHRIG